jgi:LCP family protein required for cell wall assembly
VGVVLLSTAVLLATGYGWTVYRNLNEDIATSEALPVPTVPLSPDEPFTALLVGLDSRTDAMGRPLPPELLAQLRAGEDEGQFHTDTIILLHVPAGPRARAIAVSIPRDSFVPIAYGHGKHKINSAYGRGLKAAEKTLAAQGVAGVDLDRRAREAGRRTLVATVQNLVGVRIDHFAEINLAGFVEITEAIGGVPVCLNTPMRERRSGIDLPAGRQVITGADALAFVRQRRGLEDGDLDRITRQQAFLAGLISTALSSGTLSDPQRVDRLVGAVERYVVLDRGWDLDRLLAQVRRMSGGDVSFRTIPTGTPALETPVDGIAVAVDPPAVRAFVRSVVGGSPVGTPAPVSSPGPTVPPLITARGVPCVD